MGKEVKPSDFISSEGDEKSTPRYLGRIWELFNFSLNISLGSTRLPRGDTFLKFGMGNKDQLHSWSFFYPTLNLFRPYVVSKY